MTEKIDIHKNKDRYESALRRFRTATDILPENRELLLRFLSDCELGKTIKHAQKKRIGPARCLKYLQSLKKMSNWLGKPFDKVTQEDMERFIRQLDNDGYKTPRGANYGDETKADYRKALKKFYKWLYGNNERYPELVEWIETFVKVKEVPALSKDEVERMVDRCASTKNRALLKVLFDSGARAEEFLNIRLQHVTRKEGYYMIRIEHSKTKARTISVPLCTKELDTWLETHPERSNPEAQLFPLTYDALKKATLRAGKKALGKPVNPHLLRHSSVTYYCDKLNYFQLCYRYGWAMSSKQPARYIDRQGIHDLKTVEAVKTDTISELRKENEGLKEEMVRLKERMEKTEARNEFVDKLMNALGKQGNVPELAGAIARNGLKKELDERY